jgi:Carboxypeptidase regulatory-like domain
MNRLRLLNVVLVLALATLACSLFGPGNNLPPTDVPATRVINPTREAPTQEPTEVQPTKQPVVRPTATPSSGKCTTFQADENVAWVTLDQDGQIDQQVDSYPDGADTITPIFQYNCVPKPVEIVTIFSLNGEQVYSDKETLKTTKTAGVYGYPLGTTDGTAMDDGEWGVEFYNDKKLVAAGSVEVGGNGNGNNNNNNASRSVTVEGTVTAKASGKPIAGAIVLVLQPGTSVQSFIDNGYQDADVYTGAKTDSKGQFTLTDSLDRNVGYGIVIVADGYKPVAADNFTVSDSDPDPVSLDVQLTQ